MVRPEAVGTLWQREIDLPARTRRPMIATVAGAIKRIDGYICERRSLAVFDRHRHGKRHRHRCAFATRDGAVVRLPAPEVRAIHIDVVPMDPMQESRTRLALCSRESFAGTGGCMEHAAHFKTSNQRTHGEQGLPLLLFNQLEMVAARFRIGRHMPEPDIPWSWFPSSGDTSYYKDDFSRHLYQTVRAEIPKRNISSSPGFVLA